MSVDLNPNPIRLPHGSMPRVLVIDDNEQIRRLIGLTLRCEGFEVLEAGDGDWGLRLYREQPADLVICDIFMPDKEGLETIQTLITLEPRLPIIAISGGGQVDDA